MMKWNHKSRFYLSVFLIIFLGWLDVNYAGNHTNYLIPEHFHQVIHLCFLLIVLLIGYANWKYMPQKWLIPLWFIAYGIIIILLAFTGLLVLFHVSLNSTYIMYVARLRNWFTWPIVFILFYFLPGIAASKTGNQKKS